MTKVEKSTACKCWNMLVSLLNPFGTGLIPRLDRPAVGEASESRVLWPCFAGSIASDALCLVSLGDDETLSPASGPRASQGPWFGTALLAGFGSMCSYPYPRRFFLYFSCNAQVSHCKHSKLFHFGHEHDDVEAAYVVSCSPRSPHQAL